MTKNFKFLAKFQKLQNEVEYDRLLQFSFATLTYTQSNPSSFQNYALVEKTLTLGEITKIEKTFASLSRTPAIYFENTPELVDGFINITGNKYEKKWEDSWMFFNPVIEIDNTRFSQVKKVSSENELGIFLSTFDACYQKGDPQNPYGEVKEYIINCKKAWMKFGKTDRLQYFLIYDQNRPVATSVLNTFESVGYISAVGSLKDVRGKGFGKLATLYAVSQSQANGNTEHSLPTEEGTYPNEFYKGIGFSTRFTALGYCKI